MAQAIFNYEKNEAKILVYHSAAKEYIWLSLREYELDDLILELTKLKKEIKETRKADKIK